MSDERALTQNEKTLAGLAHGSILPGVFTSGLGGIVAALVIWLAQKEKSAYTAGQALQAPVYQALALIAIVIVWCCWGLLWVLMIVIPVTSQPAMYESAPPVTMWVGLALMIVPLAVWGLTIRYGLYGTVHCFGGHEFRYAVIGKSLKSQ